MFAHQLQQYKSPPLCTQKDAHSSSPDPHNVPLHDLQYEICSTFLKLTGQKLSAQEASMMDTSKQFMDLYASFKKKSVDSSRTLDTLLQDGRDYEASMASDHSFSLPQPKSPTFSPRRQSQVTVEHLREIQQHCSYTCFIFVSNLVAEYKNMESRVKYYQNRQLLFGKHDSSKSRFHEQNLILRKKLEHQQLKVLELQEQISILKQKNRSIHSTTHKNHDSSIQNHRYFEINNKVYKDVKGYLQQKQQLLKIQSDQICAVESNIMKEIASVFEGDSCVKCCQILRKLKESILRFRKYLEGESEQFEKLYDKYKKTMYSIKSRPSL